MQLINNISPELLENLKIGQTTVFICKTNLALTQSKIQSLYKNKSLAGRKFSQKKALIVIDEHFMPLPIVLVTRNQ